MNTEQLLTERADRGEPRGADLVWSGAQSSLRTTTDEPRRPVLAFRVALGLAGLALGVLVVALAVAPATRPTTAGEGTGQDGRTGEDPGEAEQSSDDERLNPPGSPGFQRLLVDGMELVSVQRPFDPDAAEDGDDLLDRLFGPGEEVTQAPVSEGPVLTQIFADPAAPFDGPIIGIESLEDDGFRPSGANLGSDSLESYFNQLDRQDQTWFIEPSTGLEELDRVEGHPFDRLKFGWEFTFRDGAEETTLLIEPSEGRGVWVWLARSLRSHRSGFQVRSTEVLGHPGVVVDGLVEEPDSDHIYWADDEFVYRLTSARVSGFDSEAGQASTTLNRVSPVDQATWEAAVADAERDTIGLGVLAAAFTVSLVLLATIRAALRRRARRSAP